MSSQERTRCSLWRQGRFPGGSDPKQRLRIRAAQCMGRWGERWRERGTGAKRAEGKNTWSRQRDQHRCLENIDRTENRPGAAPPWPWPASVAALSAGSLRVHRGSTSRDLGRERPGAGYVTRNWPHTPEMPVLPLRRALGLVLFHWRAAW